LYNESDIPKKANKQAVEQFSTASSRQRTNQI
jgi:hypothetical protein